MFNENYDKLIDMNEVCKMIRASDIRTAEKWCKQKGIAMQIVCKKRLVHKFLVELELDKILIAHLKENHPYNWEELYKCYLEGDRFDYMMSLDTEGKKVKPKKRTKGSSKDPTIIQDFINQLN